MRYAILIIQAKDQKVNIFQEWWPNLPHSVIHLSHIYWILTKVHILYRHWEYKGEINMPLNQQNNVVKWERQDG